MELNTRKINQLALPVLKRLYKKARDAYYNKDPIMSDASFDLLEDHLKEVAPKWVAKQGTGSAVKNVKKKVRLPIPMFSLDKIKPNTAMQRLSSLSGYPGVVSLKADGASLEVIYENGKPVQAITRGDGRIGGDVSYLLPHMTIPQKVGNANFILRCEALFTTKAFSKYREVFDAARNAASGLLNRQDVHEAVKDLSIVVLQVIKPNVKLSVGLKWAKAKGFDVIPFKLVPDIGSLRVEKLVKLLMAQRTRARFQIDGLVIAKDAKNPLPTSGNPDWAFAFKVPQEGVATTVREVTWDVSHLGTLTPVLIYDPVDWDGSKLTQATAFNAKFVIDNKLGPGSKIIIERSGDIIPFVKEVVKGTRPMFPKPSQFGAYSLKGVHFVLDNPKENDTFRIKRIAKFFTEMGADFMREKTVTKLFELGFTNVSKIMRASPAMFEKAGLTAASSERLYNAIHKAIDGETPLTKLMVASATFPRGMGERRFQSLGAKFDLLKLAEQPTTKQRELISTVPGWNLKTADAFVNGMPQFLKWLSAVKVPYKNDTGAPKKAVKGVLNGVNVSWTGYRSADEEAQVTKNGGQVVPFTGKTTVLIYSPSGKISSKVAKAESKGITVVTWDQFKRKYKV